jgi:hypothetical protein
MLRERAVTTDGDDEQPPTNRIRTIAVILPTITRREERREGRRG